MSRFLNIHKLKPFHNPSNSNFDDSKHKAKESRKPAFTRSAMWKSLVIFAVVINHIILLHPSESSSAICIQTLSLPGIIMSYGNWVWRTWRWAIGPQTGFSIKVPVVSFERSKRPTGFHKSSSGCPLICTPKTGVYPHGLLARKWNSPAFIVVEDSNRDVIYQETSQKILENGRLVIHWYIKGNYCILSIFDRLSWHYILTLGLVSDSYHLGLSNNHPW